MKVVILALLEHFVVCVVLREGAEILLPMQTKTKEVMN